MALNENIKYSKKPIYDVFADIKIEEAKVRKCISQISERCLKQFKSTKDHRICANCMEAVRERKLGALV